MHASDAYISLGSNLADRDASIARALDALHAHENITVIDVAPTIDSSAITLPGADPQPDYRNTAAHLSTTLSPRDLLKQMLQTERDLGRIRTPDARWEPRTIDIDLLLHDDSVIDEPALTIPHPHMHTRQFVLEPLSHIAPDLVHPTLRLPIHTLLDRLRSAAVLLLVSLAALLPSLHAHARQQTAEQILAEAHQLLLDNPLHVEVDVHIRSDQGLESQTITIRRDQTRTLLDLATIRILIEPDACTIAHTQSARWLTLSDSQSTGWELLAQALPPIPVFLLDLLALDSTSRFSTPYLDAIVWAPPMIEDNAITLDASASLDATLTLTLESDTRTITSATYRLSTPAGANTIIQNHTPLDPAPIPDLTMGRRVRSISQLVPQAGTITVGDKLPFMLLLHPEGHADLAPPDAPTAWLLTRVEPTPHTLELLDALVRNDKFQTRVVSVRSSSNPLQALDTFDDALRPALRWSADTRTTIDQFAPDADAVLVLTDDAHSVLHIQTLESDAFEPDSILAQVEGILNE
ncbi:MAG: 2-amino-4-hydroxy-6-hydroxymethyldihydropteridine diphosphokinase [Phycisphaerales bacterium JB043]